MQVPPFVGIADQEPGRNIEACRDLGFTGEDTANCTVDLLGAIETICILQVGVPTPEQNDNAQ